MKALLPGRSALYALLALSLAGCRHQQTTQSAASPPPPIAASPEPSSRAEASPGARPLPATNGHPDVVEVGLASWYGPQYHNHRAADGSVYDQNAMTAAHKTLPLGSVVRVTNLATNAVAEVRITDRGPFIPGRIIDLSLAAAKLTDLYRTGVAKVRVEAFLPPDADPHGKWCVQVGAFLTADDATVLRNELQHRYAAARVISFAGPTGFWVRINPRLADQATAESIAASVRVPDADAYVVRLD